MKIDLTDCSGLRFKTLKSQYLWRTDGLYKNNRQIRANIIGSGDSRALHHRFDQKQPLDDLLSREFSVGDAVAIGREKPFMVTGNVRFYETAAGDQNLEASISAYDSIVIYKTENSVYVQCGNVTFCDGYQVLAPVIGSTDYANQKAILEMQDGYENLIDDSMAIGKSLVLERFGLVYEQGFLIDGTQRFCKVTSPVKQIIVLDLDAEKIPVSPVTMMFNPQPEALKARRAYEMWCSGYFSTY